MITLPLSNRLPILLLVCAGFAIGGGLASPTLSGLASQMIDRSWQGRALGVLQSAGGFGRLPGPLLGGWLLTFDLRGSNTQYGRTPFWAAGAMCLVALVLLLSVRRKSYFVSPKAAEMTGA